MSNGQTRVTNLHAMLAMYVRTQLAVYNNRLCKGHARRSGPIGQPTARHSGQWQCNNRLCKGHARRSGPIGQPTARHSGKWQCNNRLCKGQARRSGPVGQPTARHTGNRPCDNRLCQGSCDKRRWRRWIYEGAITRVDTVATGHATTACVKGHAHNDVGEECSAIRRLHLDGEVGRVARRGAPSHHFHNRWRLMRKTLWSAQEISRIRTHRSAKRDLTVK